MQITHVKCLSYEHESQNISMYDKYLWESRGNDVIVT